MTKRGRLSNKEMRFILDNQETMSCDAIAAKLGKTSEMIEKFIRKHNLQPETKNAIELINDFQETDRYKQLQGILTKTEILFFEQQYKKLLTQFAEDITHSEENDIAEVVMWDIDIARRRTGNADTIKRMDALQREIDSLASEDEMSDDEKERFAQLQTALVQFQKAIVDFDQHIIKLSEQKQKILKNLKMTRSDRINKVETKAAFLDLIKEFKKRDKQEQESRYAEMVRRAAERERKRLQSPHKYVDGQTDIPILTPDIIELDEDEATSEDSPIGQ